jgi:Putative peptidoglycan binding domain
MKRILSIICVGSLALLMPMTAQAKKHHQGDRGGDGHGHARAAAVHQGGHARIAARSHLRSRAHVTSHRARVRNRAHVTRHVNRSNRSAIAARPNHRVQTSRARTSRARNLAANSRVGTRNRVTANRQRNISRNRQVRVNRQRNARIVNHWSGQRYSGRRYAAFRNYRREWHNRGWWRDHYNRIEFVLGGWWYWDAGYWYPAWGYAPNAYYPYYGPIYTGYANLTPYQATVQVQIQLQRDGYYYGAIDGIPGPETRRALAEFQADHGLAITSAIDEPTLATLGLA